MLWYVTLRCVWLVCVPVLVFAQRTVKGVWDHFRLLDVPLCYCASEITWPSIPRTLFPYQRFDSFAQKCPEGIQEFISGTLVYVGFYGLFFLIVWIFCFQFSFLRFFVLFWFFFLVFFWSNVLQLYSFTHCSPTFQVKIWKLVELGAFVLHESRAKLKHGGNKELSPLFQKQFSRRGVTLTSSRNSSAGWLHDAHEPTRVMSTS